MQREERSDDDARPTTGRRLHEKQVQQDRARTVQHDAADAELAGVDAEERDVDLMRDPRERMPVRRVHRRERPTNVREREAFRDVAIVDDVVEVVEVRERKAERAKVDDRVADEDDEISKGGWAPLVSGRLDRRGLLPSTGFSRTFAHARGSVSD